jgi:hypothetical protein
MLCRSGAALRGPWAAAGAGTLPHPGSWHLIRAGCPYLRARLALVAQRAKGYLPSAMSSLSDYQDRAKTARAHLQQLRDGL